MAVLGWLFGGAVQRDGTAAVLEAATTGVTPAALDTAEAEIPQAVQGRRDRVLAGGQQTVVDSLAEKVLHGWLQNRHQTLFPLTVNLRSLKPEQGAALAAWMAVAALATREADAAPREWLGSVGADAAVLAVFDAALADPPALSEALAGVMRNGLAAYAYVAALIATDPRDAATPPFLDYVATRLALPTTVVRSAVRRYRR